MVWCVPFLRDDRGSVSNARPAHMASTSRHAPWDIARRRSGMPHFHFEGCEMKLAAHLQSLWDKTAKHPVAGGFWINWRRSFAYEDGWSFVWNRNGNIIGKDITRKALDIPCRCEWCADALLSDGIADHEKVWDEIRKLILPSGRRIFYANMPPWFPVAVCPECAAYLTPFVIRLVDLKLLDFSNEQLMRCIHGQQEHISGSEHRFYRELRRSKTLTPDNYRTTPIPFGDNRCWSDRWEC